MHRQLHNVTDIVAGTVPAREEQHMLSSVHPGWAPLPTSTVLVVERKKRGTASLGGLKPKYANSFGHLTSVKICGNRMLSSSFGSMPKVFRTPARKS